MVYNMTMTAKRNDSGDLEVIKLGGQTYTYRTALLVLVLSITPLGDPLWRLLGLNLPTAKASDNTSIERRVDRLEGKVDDIHKELAVVGHKLTGFIIDFDRYKTQSHPTK